MEHIGYAKLAARILTRENKEFIGSDFVWKGGKKFLLSLEKSAIISPGI